MSKENTEEFTYIRIPPDGNIMYASFRLDPSKPLPVVMTKEDKEKGDVSLSAIKTGLITAISHRGTDEIAREYFDYYKDIILSEKDALQNLNAAARVRLEKKDYKNAEVLLKALVALSPNVEDFILLSTLYASLAKDAEKKDIDAYEKYDALTLETLKSAHKMFGDEPSILMELGCFHFREGNYENAENYFDLFLKNAPLSDKRRENAENLKKKATLAIEEDEKISEVYDDLMMDRGEIGEEKAKALFAAHPKDEQYHLLYGWALRVNKKFKEAREVLLEALKLGGEEAELFNELSLSEWEVGSKDLAKEYMQMAADVDTVSSLFVSNLAYMCIHLKDFEEAERAIYELIRRDKNDPMIKELVSMFDASADHKFVFPPDEKEGDETVSDDCGCNHHGDNDRCTCHDHHGEGECHHEHVEHECKCGHHHDDEHHQCACSNHQEDEE